MKKWASLILAAILIFTMSACGKQSGNTNTDIAGNAGENVVANSEGTESGNSEENSNENTTGNSNENTSGNSNGNTAATQVKSTAGIYSDLKSWVLQNGKVNGDYVTFSADSTDYGGYSDEYFSVTYWNDGTDILEFCLHCPLNETYSHNFYIRIPKTYNGEYEYISSYYYRDTGSPKYESSGTIEAAEFTENYPLKSAKYYGASEKQNSFLEDSRVGVYDTVSCLKQFLEKENTGYTLYDLGFVKF